MSELCWVDGRVLPVDEPVIRADDAGFQLGLSVFDTVLFEDGCFYFVEEHLERLRRGAGELSIPWPPRRDPVQALRELAEAAPRDPAAYRMTYSRGPAGATPTFVVTSREVVLPPEPGVVVRVASERRLAGDPLGRLKSTNRLSYVLAREEAQASGAWEALFLSSEGDAVEGTISNVFCVVDGVLCTTSTDRGCLPGTMRAVVLGALSREPVLLDGHELEVSVDRIPEERLAAADELFLTNTTGRVIPVCQLTGLGPEGADSVELPGSSGPVTRAARERVTAAEEVYRAAQLESGIGSQTGPSAGR